MTMTSNSEITFEEIPSEQDDLDKDSATYNIKTYGADMTLELLSNQIDHKEIIVPPFQRRYVWSEKKASQLIESFLLGLPVPQIFLYRLESTQDLLVVDGQQRLKTINYFFKEKFDNESPFYLKGVKTTWEGKKYSTLNEVDRRRFKNYILRVTIFEQIDPKDHSSVYEIFKRLNTGGMPLTQQEIRNCIIRGNISDFLKELNLYKKWREILSKPQPDTRMKDIELILRYFALYERWSKYKKPMKEFMNDYMSDNRTLTAKRINELKDIFYLTIDIIYSNLGKSAFRRKAGINVAIFDSVMVAVSLIGPKKIKDFKTKYKKLLGEDAYLDSISNHTTDAEKVTTRIKLALNHLK